MSEEDNGISLKYDFENINKINYPHLSVRELIDIVGNEEPPEILKYIRENKLIIDTSQSVSESADLAFIFNAFFLVATKTLLVVASKDGELKSGYIKKYESEPENFSIRESEDGEVEWYYSKPLDVETYTSKLLSSVKDIYTYSPKAMNAMATVEGLSASPDITDENKHFLFSKTTNLPVLKHSYFGNASLLGYAMSLTFIVKTSEGYGSIYSLVENNKGLVRDIFEKSILNEYACDITDVLDQDMENKNSFEHQSNVTVNNLLKQIYFPVNNREHHLLVIMNHPGLRKCFSQYMTLLRDSSFYYQGKELDKNKIHKLRVPTRSMNVGGAQPQNSGEILNSIGGNLRMLMADAPQKLTVDSSKINPHQLLRIEKSKNIFSIIHNRYFIIKRDDKKKRNHHLMKIFSQHVSKNMHTKKAREIALREIAYKMLYPIFVAINNRDVLEDSIKEMSSKMQKLISPDVYKGSMTADDYNNLADEAYKEISKKMVIKIDNEVQILDSESVDIMKKQIQQILRKI